MAKITLEQIEATLQPVKWLVLDKEYVNLKTPMHFRCNEGHLVETTWEKLRNKIECPVCRKNLSLNIRSICAQPKTSEFRILALDQSSKVTGYSIYDGQKLISYGVYKTEKFDPYDRISDLCDWLDSMIKAWKPDLVGFEETQYQEMQNNEGHNVFKLLSQVMGAIIITAMRAGCRVAGVLIPTWRHHCKVKGNHRADQKRSAQILVKTWHDVSVTEDESDAICIGKYFADTRQKAKKQIGFFE